MATDTRKFLERLKKVEGQLERLANDFFIADSFVEATYGSLWRPPADVFETDRDVVVRMEVPGLHVEDISISLHPEAVVIRAVRREANRDTKCGCHQLEIHYGFFERVIPVPRCIRHDEAQAEYVEGFVVVSIPKCEEVVELTEVVHLHI
jgi:HSP20 family protein